MPQECSTQKSDTKVFVIYMPKWTLETHERDDDFEKFLQNLYENFFIFTAILKIVYSKHLHTLFLDFTTNALLYLLYHKSIHLYITLLIFCAFLSKEFEDISILCSKLFSMCVIKKETVELNV